MDEPQSNLWNEGYDAFWAGIDFNDLMPEEWREGWDSACIDANPYDYYGD